MAVKREHLARYHVLRHDTARMHAKHAHTSKNSSTHACARTRSDVCEESSLLEALAEITTLQHLGLGAARCRMGTLCPPPTHAQTPLPHTYERTHVQRT